MVAADVRRCVTHWIACWNAFVVGFNRCELTAAPLFGRRRKYLEEHL